VVVVRVLVERASFKRSFNSLSSGGREAEKQGGR